MEDRHLYVMAGYDEETEKYFAGIQQKFYDVGLYGTHTKNLPQHITFDKFPVEMETELIERVKHIAATTKPFDITFNHIGIFQGSKVIFIAPDTNHDLLNLKEKFGDSFDWTAHTTMLLDDPDKIAQAMPIVLNEFSAHKGKVTSLIVYEFWPSRHILTVKLEG